MNFSSIVCKSLFILTILLYVISICNIEVIDNIISISIIPIIIVNILVILNNISITIQDKTNDQKNNIIKHLKIIIL